MDIEKFLRFVSNYQRFLAFQIVLLAGINIGVTFKDMDEVHTLRVSIQNLTYTLICLIFLLPRIQHDQQTLNIGHRILNLVAGLAFLSLGVLLFYMAVLVPITEDWSEILSALVGGQFHTSLGLLLCARGVKGENLFSAVSDAHP